MLLSLKFLKMFCYSFRFIHVSSDIMLQLVVQKFTSSPYSEPFSSSSSPATDIVSKAPSGDGMELVWIVAPVCIAVILILLIVLIIVYIRWLMTVVLWTRRTCIWVNLLFDAVFCALILVVLHHSRCVPSGKKVKFQWFCATCKISDLKLACEGLSNTMTQLCFPSSAFSGTSLLGKQGQICFAEYLKNCEMVFD